MNERPGLIGARSKAQVLDLFARHVSSGRVRFFQDAGIDFVLGRREGPYLWDLSAEKRLIDCHCNGGVFNLGHRNPGIIAALERSLRELDVGNHHLISEQRAALAQRLAQLAPGNLPYTVFAVGGGEAVDLAIKVARGYTRRPNIISAKGGYHGHTGLALAAGDEKYRAPFGPMPPGFSQVPFNDVAALEQAVNRETAAVILETVPATYGMPIANPDYFAQVRALCDRAGALLIVDEIQTGLGRTGKLWGIQHFGVEPDIMVIGKGLSGGIYPMAATCFRAELEAVFHKDPFIHISTFGGAEVGCPVALKVLEISSDPAFLRHVEEIAGLFAEGFARLREKHPGVLVRLRQLGMMMGIEMVNPYCGPLFSKAAYDAGLLSVYAYNDTRVAQFLPPLTIDRPLAEEILQRVDAALSGVEAFLRGGAHD
ncbi:MAG: aspartate aminotransferase family protein [Anaerolineae bacterium]|nr:aspartate aminotransferase family protein [Anaerolineae bacterium]